MEQQYTDAELIALGKLAVNNEWQQEQARLAQLEVKRQEDEKIKDQLWGFGAIFISAAAFAALGAGIYSLPLAAVASLAFLAWKVRREKRPAQLQEGGTQ